MDEVDRRLAAISATLQQLTDSHVADVTEFREFRDETERRIHEFREETERRVRELREESERQWRASREKHDREIGQIITVQTQQQRQIEAVVLVAQENTRSILELRESQKHTDDRLNALIRGVDDLVRRNGGRQQP